VSLRGPDKDISRGTYGPSATVWRPLHELNVISVICPISAMEASCKQSVIVIGGGFAGLAAAAELSLHKTVQVTLVEAADYLGGRVKQVRPFKGCQLLDVGGEFIHGEKTTAAKLAKEFSWKIEEIGFEGGASSTSYAFIDGKLSLLNESNKMFSRARNVYGQFMSCGRKIRKGLLASEHKSDPYAHHNKGNEPHHRAENQKDLSVKQFVEQLGNVDKSCQKLIEAYYCQTEGNDLDRIGMLEFSRAEDVWKYGSSDYRLKDSYSVLVSHFIQKCRTQNVDVHLNWEAKTVSWGGDSPSFVSNKESKCVFGDFILVTVPLQVLKEGVLEFAPDIPASKKETLGYMEMRSGCKMFCCFTEKFWPLNLHVLYCEQPSTFTQIWTEDSYTNDGKQSHSVWVLHCYISREVIEDS